jgi:hypothetical protein
VVPLVARGQFAVSDLQGMARIGFGGTKDFGQPGA